MTDWQIATLIDSKMVSEDVKSLTFTLPHFTKHIAGQHYDIRLTAPNGYQSERSYSVASAPEEIGKVEFGIQLLKNGEVSPYLYELEKSETIELKGPIGGHFVWESNMSGPLILIGGGSGMVPLMSMLRHNMNNTPEREVLFLASAKTKSRVLYLDELEEYSSRYSSFHFVYTLTHESNEKFPSYSKRIDKDILMKEIDFVIKSEPNIYLCGPTSFVESMANILVEMNINPGSIKTERFG